MKKIKNHPLVIQGEIKMENQNKPQAETSHQNSEIKKVDGDSHQSQEKKAPGHQESGSKTVEQEKQSKDHSKDQN